MSGPTHIFSDNREKDMDMIRNMPGAKMVVGVMKYVEPCVAEAEKQRLEKMPGERKVYWRDSGKKP